MPNQCSLEEGANLLTRFTLLGSGQNHAKTKQRENIMPITQSPPMANLFLVMRARASFHREEPCDIADAFSTMVLFGSGTQSHAGI